MKIKEKIQEHFKRCNILINEEPAHEEIHENSVYISDKDFCSFKSWKVKIDFTKSGYSNLCRIFDNKTHNSYFFFRSSLPKGEKIKQLLSEIDEIIKDESFETKIEKERKKFIDDERTEFGKILNKLECLHKEIVSYSSNYTSKGTDVSNALLESANNTLKIANNITVVRNALHTQNRLLLEHCKQKLNEKVTFDSILGMLSEIHMKKNADYGDSFTKNFERFGKNALAIPIYNKIDRINNLMSADKEANNESLLDSWLDLASYSIMAYQELRNKF